MTSQPQGPVHSASTLCSATKIFIPPVRPASTALDCCHDGAIPRYVVIRYCGHTRSIYIYISVVSSGGCDGHHDSSFIHMALQCTHQTSTEYLVTIVDVMRSPWLYLQMSSLLRAFVGFWRSGLKNVNRPRMLLTLLSQQPEIH
jgi:hypothetical protein